MRLAVVEAAFVSSWRLFVGTLLLSGDRYRALEICLLRLPLILSFLVA
jgi:hypothetical protein